MHEISDVERAVNLRVAGVSYADIADRLGVDVIEAEDMVAGYLSAMSSESPDIRIRLELSRLCLLYTSPSPRDATLSPMPSSS